MAIGSPKIVGILNITDDSFSDGGRYREPQAAIVHARSLVAAGADIVELGAVASNPDADPVEPVEEIRRLAPLLDALEGGAVAVSVDSCSPTTQSYCIERGVSYLNDITGFSRPEFYPRLAAASCGLVVMHSLRAAARATREVTDAVSVAAGIIRFFSARIRALEEAGVDPRRIVIDPGMGLFLGATAAPSVHVLSSLESLRSRFAKPVMVSVSRKSFLGALTGRAVAERGPASLAAEIYAAMQGVEFLRTHDVAALADGLAVLRALQAAAGSG